MVRCCECGYLSAYHRERRMRDAVNSEMRESWNVTGADKAAEIFDRVPVCYVDAVDFHDELPDISLKLTDVTAVITKERSCEEFVELDSRLTPKEHKARADMIELQKMQNAQRDRDRQWQDEWRVREQQREDKRSDKEQEREDKRSETDRQFQLTLKQMEMKSQAERDKLNRNTTLYSVIATGLIAIIAALSGKAMEILWPRDATTSNHEPAKNK
jgi:hypothetical protein